ncbi:MAG: hypothetical protein R3F30_14930 [Planctomycetota bacterium]
MTATIPLLLLLALQGQADEPAPLLPEPTGPFLVGTRILTLVDEAREEVLTAEAGDKRELVVQLWYPSEKRGKERPAGWRTHYVPFFATMRPLLERQYGRPQAEALGRLEVPAGTDAPLVRSPRKLPVILFSHGQRTARFYYTSTLLELASHGYVVVSPDHSYDIEGVAFPDGRLVEGLHSAERKAAADAIDASWHEPDARVGIWAKDLSFLLDRLTSRGRDKEPFLDGRLDARRVFAVGHCCGGMAALEVGLEDKRIKAVVAENAWPLPGPVRKRELGKPVLMLDSGHTTTTESLKAQGLSDAEVAKLAAGYRAEQRKEIARLAAPGWQVVLSEARHMSFSDQYQLEPFMLAPRQATLTGPDRDLRRALDHLLAFLAQECTGKHQDLLDPVDDRDGVEVWTSDEGGRKRRR